MIECTVSQSRWKSNVCVCVCPSSESEMNIFRFFSFIHCPSVALLSEWAVRGTEAGLQAASLRPFDGSLLSGGPGAHGSLLLLLKTKWVKSTILDGRRRRRRGLAGRFVRQASGCQRAEGRVPNICSVRASNKEPLSVSVWSREGVVALRRLQPTRGAPAQVRTGRTPVAYFPSVRQ